ncbi:MAG TPA: FAD-binding protein, partial [Bacteroidia bacterium]|nr:FAD-binding protein [Bacteroidia bacterium]
MAKKYSRKDFIKLSSVAGAGLLLAACGTSGNDQHKDSTFANPDSSKKDPGKDEKKTSVELIYNEDPRYSDLRKGFNKRINKYPLVIALCTSTNDVAEAIQFARKNKLEIAVKSGGHSMEGFSSNDGGMVINLSKMNSVEFLEDNKIKTGPGCTLSHLYDNILPKKRIIPAGSCGTVGLGGLTMGGGYGLFARKYGLTCDNLLEATMVDGNGMIHSTKDDPELLWALRGGGAGNFGVVTELIYQSHEAPENMQAH